MAFSPSASGLVMCSVVSDQDECPKGGSHEPGPEKYAGRTEHRDKGSKIRHVTYHYVRICKKCRKVCETRDQLT